MNNFGIAENIEQVKDRLYKYADQQYERGFKNGKAYIKNRMTKINGTRLIYLAHPYIRNPDLNFKKAIRDFIRISELKQFEKDCFISPIISGHSIEFYCKRGESFWNNHSIKLLSKCDAMLIREGMTNISNGCNNEVKFALENDIEVITLESVNDDGLMR